MKAWYGGASRGVRVTVSQGDGLARDGLGGAGGAALDDDGGVRDGLEDGGEGVGDVFGQGRHGKGVVLHRDAIGCVPARKLLVLARRAGGEEGDGLARDGLGGAGGAALDDDGGVRDGLEDGGEDVFLAALDVGGHGEDIALAEGNAFGDFPALERLVRARLAGLEGNRIPGEGAEGVGGGAIREGGGAILDGDGGVRL